MATRNQIQRIRAAEKLSRDLYMQDVQRAAKELVGSSPKDLKTAMFAYASEIAYGGQRGDPAYRRALAVLDASPRSARLTMRKIGDIIGTSMDGDLRRLEDIVKPAAFTAAYQDIEDAYELATLPRRG
jgi:hypothetical protein